MTDDLFQLLRDDMKDGFREVCDRLDQMNGRVRHTEVEIAVIKATSARKAAWLGGGSAAAVAGLLEAIRSYFK